MVGQTREYVDTGAGVGESVLVRRIGRSVRALSKSVVEGSERVKNG